MTKNGNEISRICANVGVEIIEGTQAVRAGQTTARATLNRILRDHGEGHVTLLLRTFVETENSETRIDAFALYAVSDIMIRHPEWADSGLRWLETFDRIDLGGLQERAKANRDVVSQRYGIATLLYNELSAAFSRPAPDSTREDVMATNNDLLYGTRAIAVFLEIGTVKCRHLISTGAVPTFTMPGSTTRCARKSTLNALWAACEAEATGEPRRAAVGRC